MAGRGSLGGRVGGYAVRVLLLLMLLAASGAVPGLADVNATFGPWDQPATRGWFARALRQALDSYYSVERVP